MKKNTIFLIFMIIIVALLFLLRVTGLVPHIIISVLGLIGMILYTVQTHKDWKVPSLEILMRAMYLIAIVSGGLLMKIHGVAAIAVVHKISAILFVALLLILYIPKSIRK
jgi:hypothetical protein